MRGPEFPSKLASRRFRRGCVVVSLIGWSTLWCQSPSTPQNNVDLSAPNLAAHARLPQNDRPGSPLQEILTRAQARATAKGLASHDVTGRLIDEPAALTNVAGFFQKLACSADAIVVGHPTQSKYHVAAHGAAVYGDYDFLIETVLRTNVATQINPNTHIIVTRPGGSILIDDAGVTDDNEAYPILAGTSKYVLFLSYIPETGGYQPVNAFGTLVLSGTTWKIARKGYSNDTSPDLSQGTFESEIAGSLQNCKL